MTGDKKILILLKLCKLMRKGEGVQGCAKYFYFPKILRLRKIVPLFIIHIKNKIIYILTNHVLLRTSSVIFCNMVCSGIPSLGTSISCWIILWTLVRVACWSQTLRRGSSTDRQNPSIQQNFLNFRTSNAKGWTSKIFLR